MVRGQKLCARALRAWSRLTVHGASSVDDFCFLIFLIDEHFLMISSCYIAQKLELDVCDKMKVLRKWGSWRNWKIFRVQCTKIESKIESKIYIFNISNIFKQWMHFWGRSLNNDIWWHFKCLKYVLYWFQEIYREIIFLRFWVFLFKHFNYTLMPC